MKDSDLILYQHNPQSAEKALQTNSDDRPITENSYPTARFRFPEGDRQNHGHQPHSGSDEAVGMFVKNSSDPAGNRKKKHVIPKRVGPVRHRHSRAVRGNETAAANQDKGQ